MLVMHFGHPVPEMHSHHATSDYAAVLRPQRRTTMRCDTAPTMTLRRDASPASPVDARLSRAPRLRLRLSMSRRKGLSLTDIQVRVRTRLQKGPRLRVRKSEAPRSGSRRVARVAEDGIFRAPHRSGQQAERQKGMRIATTSTMHDQDRSAKVHSPATTRMPVPTVAIIVMAVILSMKLITASGFAC